MGTLWRSSRSATTTCGGGVCARRWGRQRSGVRRYRIFQVDDPNYVMVDLDFDTAKEAQGFLEILRTQVWPSPEKAPPRPGPQRRASSSWWRATRNTDGCVGVSTRREPAIAPPEALVAAAILHAVQGQGCSRPAIRPPDADQRSDRVPQATGEMRTTEVGQVLIRAGDRASDFIVVLDGEVGWLTTSRAGAERSGCSWQATSRVS